MLKLLPLSLKKSLPPLDSSRAHLDPLVYALFMTANEDDPNYIILDSGERDGEYHFTAWDRFDGGFITLSLSSLAQRNYHRCRIVTEPLSSWIDFDSNSKVYDDFDLPKGMFFVYMRAPLEKGVTVLDYRHDGRRIKYREAYFSPEVTRLLTKKFEVPRCVQFTSQNEEEGTVKVRVADHYRDAFDSFFREHKVKWSKCKRILKADAFADHPEDQSLWMHPEFASPEWPGWTGVVALAKGDELKGNHGSNGKSC